VGFKTEKLVATVGGIFVAMVLYVLARIDVAMATEPLTAQSRLRKPVDSDEVEQRLGLKLPDRHRKAMLDPTDPIHEACDFLLPASEHQLLRIVDVNQFLHASDGGRRAWPDFLVAFASNGCGDYFAYDVRKEPAGIIYIDHDLTVDENLVAEVRLEFESFEEWYRSRLRR
jgi:hypothetical protein